MDKEDEETSKTTQSPQLELQNDAPLRPASELDQPEVICGGGVIGEGESSGGFAVEVGGKVGFSVANREVEGGEEVEEVAGNLVGNAVEESVLGDNLEEVEGAGYNRAVNENVGFIEGVEAVEGSAGDHVVIGEVGSVVGVDDKDDKGLLDSVGDVEAVGVVEVNENDGLMEGAEAVEGLDGENVVTDDLDSAVGADGENVVTDDLDSAVGADGENVVTDEVDSAVGADDNEDMEVLDSVVENDKDETVSNVVENEVVDGVGDKLVEDEKGDREVADVRKDIQVGDVGEGLVVAKVPEESAMPKEREHEVVAEVVEDKEVTEDANLVEAISTEMSVGMEMKPIEEMVEGKELAVVAKTPIEMAMPSATEDRTISDVLEGEGMVEDSCVAETTENKTVLGTTEDTEAEAAIEGKGLAEEVFVVDGPGDTVMHEGKEEPPVAELEFKELGANASKEQEETSTNEEVEGMAVDNLVEVNDLGGNEDVARAPKYNTISEATLALATEQAVEVNKLAEDADGVDTCMTDATEHMEMAGEIETDAVKEGRKAVAGKRKRGRPSTKTTTRNKMEEDVCFICFDGGDLVLCDRRGCPKAYHPACVNRDEAFFRTKGQWNCGWHLCTACQKNAYYMCYTCTFSLCKGCIKDATILCIRGNKGFCQTCMKTIMLIEENNQQNMEEAQVNFDEKSSWEYLFKDYWLDLKGRLLITSNELAEARNPWKGVAGRHDLPDGLNDPNSSVVTASDHKSENVEVLNAKRKKAKKHLRLSVGEESSAGTSMEIVSGRPSTDEGSDWASKELLEFVMHMKKGDKSFQSQFDVQALLLEYIKRHKLRDPRRKSQIICDSMLQNLFGKQRVGHFEMLKLLESHFLNKEDPQADDLRGSVVDTETSQLEVDGNSNALTKTSKDKKRKNRRKGDGRAAQTNLEDYAAIDMHNINLIYLRRNLVEELLEDVECFHEKVVGAFVRIRIFGSNQKQDIYRLVQVVGATKTAEPYKVGKRMTDIVLEILNLNKTEVLSIDVISNQDFTEDECKRLRQSIKCGLINRLTLGDILEKAMALQAVRVNDWIQSETMRVSHLRDRASDLGRRKELRECVEKLQLLKTPEERERRLEEVPEVHADPKMDPSHESEEDEDDMRRETFTRPPSFSKKVREAVSPRNELTGSGEPWGENRNYTSMKRDLTRNSSAKDLWNKSGENNSGEKLNKFTLNQGIEKEVLPSMKEEKSKVVSASQYSAGYTNTEKMIESVSSVVSVYSPVRLSAEVAKSSDRINESEKLWHYRDPSGKIQGPFSMAQLRKWNNTGYFPAELRIWKSTEKQEDSIILTDALTGKFQKDPLVLEKSALRAPVLDIRDLPSAYAGKPYDISLRQLKEAQGGETFISESASKRTATSKNELPKFSATGWSSDINHRENLTNLPSPTPLSNENRVQSYESKGNSNSPSVRLEGSALEGNQFSGGNVLQHSSAAVSVTDRVPHASPLGMSTVRVSCRIDDSNMLNMSPTPGLGKISPISQQTGSQPTMAGDSHINLSMLPAIDSPRTPANVGVSLQNVCMYGGGNNPPVVSQGFVIAPRQNMEPSIPNVTPSQPSAYGHWGSASTNTSGSFTIPNSSGFPLSESWGSVINNNQTNIQPTGTPNLPRLMGLADNQGAIPVRGQVNQSTAWGQIPMAGKPTNHSGGPHPGNPNMQWGALGQGPAFGTANPSWTAHGQAAAPASGQAAAPGNAIPGWIPGNQGAAPVIMNSYWHPPGQGLPPGNANSGRSGPTENLGRWGGDQNSIRESFSGQRERDSHGRDTAYDRDRVSHGRDTAYSKDRDSHGRDTAYGRDRVSHGDGRGRPWNRQGSIGSGGGGTSRPFLKARSVCKFHENGHCRKGASCDYLHT